MQKRFLQPLGLRVSVALFASLAIGALAASPQASTKASTGKASAAKKKSAVAKASTTKAATKAPATAAAKRPTASKSSAQKKAIPVVHHPQQPSQERLKEIQQALADKGYFHSEPDGAWGPTSIDALKHFQRDQKLVDDGKIGSLSLIALGLGPKRDPIEPSKTSEPEQKIP